MDIVLKNKNDEGWKLVYCVSAGSVPWRPAGRMDSWFVLQIALTGIVSSLSGKNLSELSVYQIDQRQSQGSN